MVATEERPITFRTLDTLKDLQAGVRHLRRVCPAMRAIHDRAGDPPLRRYTADFSGLARIVVGQQLSIASANAIWSRVETLVRPITAEALMAASPVALGKAGLSGGKIRTLLALADGVMARRINLAKLKRLPDDDVRLHLTTVSGIGPWTADIYVMFCLGRADGWASGDLALQVGAARALGLGERLTVTEAENAAQRWSPWRGVAARLIWADYAHLRAQPFAGTTSTSPLRPTASAAARPKAPSRLRKASQPRKDRT